MKRIFLSIGIIGSILFAETAIAFTQEEQKIIETRLTEIQEKIDIEWEKYREYYEYTLQEEKENTENETQKKVIDEILLKIQKKKEASIEIQETLSEYNIDTQKVLETWLEWQNKVRTDTWLGVYSYAFPLNNSALKWSQISKNKWYIDHKRNSWDAYYDYWKISKWMDTEGASCKKVSGKTFSESIGYGVFTCNDEECSDELIEWIRGTFNFFMSEKGKKYDPHYRAIISPYFSSIGTGIELVKTGKNTYKYYLTTHYCTELITNQK